MSTESKTPLTDSELHDWDESGHELNPDGDWVPADLARQLEHALRTVRPWVDNHSSFAGGYQMLRVIDNAIKEDE
jgi:hypothetical protein